MFSNDRNQMRKMFVDSWRAKREGSPLDPLQNIIVSIVEQHPEYHSLLENEDALDQDYTPEQGLTNPFLHMSMHIALLEQISTNRPAGIRDCYQKLSEKHGSAHEAEHAMMECLGEALWQAQRDGQMPDEDRYLDCLRRLANITKP